MESVCHQAETHLEAGKPVRMPRCGSRSCARLLGMGEHTSNAGRRTPLDTRQHSRDMPTTRSPAHSPPSSSSIFRGCRTPSPSPRGPPASSDPGVEVRKLLVNSVLVYNLHEMVFRRIRSVAGPGFQPFPKCSRRFIMSICDVIFSHSPESALVPNAGFVLSS